LSVAYATQKKKKAGVREDPTTCGVVEYVYEESAPRGGGIIPKALGVGFAVPAAARFNLAGSIL
jgi:hypothetical protein